MLGLLPPLPSPWFNVSWMSYDNCKLPRLSGWFCCAKAQSMATKVLNLWKVLHNRVSKHTSWTENATSFPHSQWLKWEWRSHGNRGAAGEEKAPKLHHHCKHLFQLVSLPSYKNHWWGGVSKQWLTISGDCLSDTWRWFPNQMHVNTSFQLWPQEK